MDLDVLLVDFEMYFIRSVCFLVHVRTYVKSISMDQFHGWSLWAYAFRIEKQMEYFSLGLCTEGKMKEAPTRCGCCPMYSIHTLQSPSIIIHAP